MIVLKPSTQRHIRPHRSPPAHPERRQPEPGTLLPSGASPRRCGLIATVHTGPGNESTSCHAEGASRPLNRQSGVVWFCTTARTGSGSFPHLDREPCGGLGRSTACGKEPEKYRSGSLWRERTGGLGATARACGRISGQSAGEGWLGSPSCSTSRSFHLTAVRAQSSTLASPGSGATISLVGPTGSLPRFLRTVHITNNTTLQA